LRSPPISADEQVRERWCWFTSFGRLYKLKSVLRSPRLASSVVVADDRYIEKALRKLVVLLQAAGAAIADGLVIRCVAGDLSIEAPMVRRGTMLIRMPEHCLIPLKAFKLALVNDEIVISSPQCGLNKATVAITEAMFEVYNLSRKMAQHCSKSPWSLIASHLDLLSYITPPSRDDFPFSARDLRSGDKAKVMLASFLHSRLFTHQPNEQTRPRPVLVPVTDFLNHHWTGAPYSYDHYRAVVMRRSAPLPGNGDECFASYGLHDAYDTWISYGFVDEDVPFAQSLFTTVDLPRTGKIRLGLMTPETNGMVVSVRDLRTYIPPILSRKGKCLNIGAVLIPGPQAPRALRRALKLLIGELGAPRNRHRDLVIAAEEQIIDANLTYYAELKSLLKRLTVDNEVHRAIRASFVRLCEQQIARVRNYIGYAEY
jgi:hypothetical protein